MKTQSHIALPTSAAEVRDWLTHLDEVSGAMNFASRDLKSTVDLLAQRLKPSLNVDAIAVWTVEPDTQFIRIEASVGLSPQFVRFFNQSDRVRVGQGIVGKVMSEKVSRTSVDVATDEHFEIERWREVHQHDRICALLSTPMFVGSHIVGALCLYYHAPHTFAPEEVRVVEVLSNQLAVTIQNIKDYNVINSEREKLEVQLQKLFKLQRVTELLDVGIAQSIDTSLKELLEYLSSTFKSSAIAVFEPRDQVFAITINVGLSEQFCRYLEQHPIRTGPENLIGKAFISAQPTTSTRAMTDDSVPRTFSTALSNDGLIAVGAFPLVTRGKALGVLVIFYRNVHDFTADEISILDLLSRFIGVSFENSRTLHALVEEKEKMRAMVNSLTDGILVYDNGGTIIECNPRAEELVGRARVGIIGRNFTGNLASQEPQEQKGDLRVVSTMFLNNKETKELTVGAETQKITMRVSQIQYRIPGLEELGYMRILHDISSEKAVETLKANFVMTASHQMRTPLTAIKWTLEVLMRESDSPNNARELLKHAYERTEYMIYLVNELLTTSNVEDATTYKFERVDITSLVNDIVEDFRSQVQMRVKFTCTVPHHIPSVTIDRSKFDMALRNLIDNAVKYTHDGFIDVSLVVQSDVLDIVVADSGIGIPEGDNKFLFNKFFRSANAVRIKPNGSGLGLYLVRSIVERHNGTIHVDSEEHKGSRFTITLPLSESMMPARES